MKPEQKKLANKPENSKKELTDDAKKDQAAPSSKKPRQHKRPPIDLGKSLSRFLYRYHFVLFVVVILGGTAVVVLMINNAMIDASDTSSATSSTSASFDERTMEMLGELDDTSTQRPLYIPPGRSNPFTE